MAAQAKKLGDTYLRKQVGEQSKVMDTYNTSYERDIGKRMYVYGLCRQKLKVLSENK
jgi:hypothetical protein